MEPDIYLVGHRCMKGLLGVAGYLISNVERWMFFISPFLFIFSWKKQLTTTLPETNIAPENGWLEY